MELFFESLVNLTGYNYQKIY